MVRTNFQEFIGDVHVLSNLQVGSNLFANDLAANVLTVDGSIGSTFFIGDGGLLSNIATTLNDIVANPGGNTVSNTLVFESGADATSNTAIVTYANVGISVSNTNPTGEYQLSIGSNIFVNTHASNVLTIIGSVGANTFIGDGGLLSNIATTLDAIIDQGNTVSNTIQLISGMDATSNTGLVTHKDVGISISNTEPTGEFQFGVGSNLLVNVYSSNVLSIEGNVNAEKMTLGTISVASAYGLNHVTAQGSSTGDTISLTNATTGLSASSNITAGGNVTAETLISTANVEVGNRLKFSGSNVFVDDLRVADLAANLVTYDKTTGELMDSGGLFANKLAVVSVQPPSALTANATTVAKHGTYTVTTSSLAANSNAWNAFDGDSAVEWLASTTIAHLYNGGNGLYSGTSNLFAGNYIQPGVSSAGEWLAIEFPYKTTLRHMKLTPPATFQQYPASANLYATNDSLTWTELTNWSDVNPVTSSNVQTVIVNATETFKKYALSVTKTNGSNTNTALAKWQLFTESFSIDGGKVAMAQQAATGGETVMDQSGPHGRLPNTVPLKKYPEIAFDGEIGNFVSIPNKGDHNQISNTYIIGGHKVVASSEITHNSSRMSAWKLFDSGVTEGEYSGWGLAEAFNAYNAANPGEYPSSGTARLATTDVDGNSIETGGWIYIKLPNKIKLKRYSLKPWGIANRYGVADYPKEFYIYASNDGTNWKLINSQTNPQTPSVLGSSDSSQETISYDVSQTGLGYYSYYAMTIRKINSVAVQAIDNTVQATYMLIGEWELYGYEEDPPAGDTSVDTTFTSIMNTPQTTGANVYVDANLSSDFTNRVVGPTVSNTHTTYVSAGKYWELSGNVESNVTIEANTFLEGDAPHSVSVWFNSSNLEANVSNTCVFSIASEEKLDSVNLDLQSNTWHNLTYAYQGEGGSRVTYLDGRKVAEDQAEDTFGDYPPFAMTGYSQGGYVVSVSSTHLESVYRPFYAFNDIITDVNHVWHSDTSSYTGTSNQYNGIGRLAANVDLGDWIKLETPHKIKVSYINITARPPDAVAGNLESQAPSDFQVCGSNDNVNWDVLASFTGEAPQDDGSSYYIVNAQRGYKYLAIAVNKTVGSTSLTISNIKYYGHRENDLVRFPDPTNVLKYPHIAMTGPAQRGYVVSASAGENPSAPWEAFDGSVATNTSGWIYPTSGTHNLGTDSGSGTATDGGHWIRLELPHKLVVNRVDVISDAQNPQGRDEFPDEYAIYGWNGSGTWTKLLDVTGKNPTAGTSTTFSDTISNSTAYKHIALVAKSYYNNSTSYGRIAEIKYYGTGVDSIPIQIGGGNIDKVANFRVYDRFIEEDQALEIWDAQKDEFGRAKSSMTLHKGRLGIGTTEPEGRLAVLDEPESGLEGLQEFPPKPLVGYKTHIEGHGVFCVTESSFDDSSTDRHGWRAFNKSHMRTSDGNLYTSEYDPISYYTTGIATGNNGVLNGVNGEYLILESPYKIKLSHVLIYPRIHVSSSVSYSLPPKDGKIWGRNTIAEPWTEITSYANLTYGATRDDNLYGQIPTRVNINATQYYKYIAFQITATNISLATWATKSYVNFKELRYFGYREQVTKQSVLHDGQLTLTKNLNVPRIGPALDADDTPRRDRLVVEYNTSTNPTFEGAVRDTSGRGLDGILKGSSALYDTIEKSLKVTTAGDAIKSFPLNNPAGAYPNSFSFWFKTNGTANRTICVIGGDTGNNSHGIFINNAGKINQYHFFNDKNYDEDIRHGQWYHIVATYDGGSVATSRRLWLNGKELTAYTITGTLGAPNIPANTTLFVCSRAYDTNVFDGSVSNFKLYDVALTAEEAKTLYDMGRCDEGHHMVNFSKTRVGIGLGDGEAPQATLDVRGDIRYINIAPIALPTFYDHILAGRSDRGIYPIVGTQGGTKIYNVYCEPDMFGGGWMCFAQVPQEGPSSDAWNLYTDEKGNSNIFLSPQNSTTRRHAMFSVPMNILSSNNGVNLDVLLMVYGNALRYNGTFGAKVGAIWRGVNLNIAFDSTASGSVGTDSNQARSSNGVDFTASSKALYKGNPGWDFSITVNGEAVDGGYGDTNDGTAGYIVHEVPGGWNIYCDAIVGPGGTWQYFNNPNWEYVRFFVRPSSF